MTYPLATCSRSLKKAIGEIDLAGRPDSFLELGQAEILSSDHLSNEPLRDIEKSLDADGLTYICVRVYIGPEDGVDSYEKVLDSSVDNVITHRDVKLPYGS